MPSNSERRSQSDRRRGTRGGRRQQDAEGFAPLVLVVGSGTEPRDESEAILGRLRFAVAPAADLPEALRVIPTLNPDVIVAPPADAARLRLETPLGVPVVEYSGSEDNPESLIERVREAIRGSARARA